MQNARELRALCDRHGIPIMLDATRAVENAYFIQQREPGYAGKKIAEILREFCAYTDGCTMSGKKDALVNIGGWLALNDREKYDEASNLVVVYEGLHTYGGHGRPRHGGDGARHRGVGGRRPHALAHRPGATTWARS